MTKVLKTLASGALAAALGAVLLGFSGNFGASDAEAQAPPARPARFAGSVLVDGTPPPAGTTITAVIGGTTCGVTQTFNVGAESRYVVDVQAEDPGAELACGTEDAVVNFIIGDKPAKESGAWRDFDINVLNLTYTTPATPTATPTDGTPTGTATTPGGGGTATGTPAPPSTGTGTAGDDINILWVLGLAGAAAIAFSAGGVAVVRRSR
jgi:hypothetical protein